MAVFNLNNYQSKDGFSMSLNMRRGNPNPLDNSALWGSLEAAQNYARTDSVAYVGQILAVAETIDEVLPNGKIYPDITITNATAKTSNTYKYQIANNKVVFYDRYAQEVSVETVGYDIVCTNNVPTSITVNAVTYSVTPDENGYKVVDTNDATKTLYTIVITQVPQIQVVTAYVIDNEYGDLKKIGVVPTGDNKTIEVTTAGVISLLGAANAANGTLPMIDSETGKLVWKTLEDIGAGDGDTTYEIEELRKNKLDENGADTGNEDPEGEIYGIKYRAIPLGATAEEKEAILWNKIPFDVYTKSEVDAAIKEVADLVGVPAEDDESTDTLYERIAAEVLRATNAESALSDRIGAAKDGETAATGVYAYVDGVVNALVNGVDPDKIDSLNELIAWVEAHPAIVEELDGRLDKVEGRLDKVEGILDGFGGEEEPETVKGYIDAHALAADGKYATKQEIATAGYAVAADVENTYVTKETATTDNGLRFINQTEINKLAKLNLDNGEITISGSVNANQVKELYNTVVNIVKGSTADLDPDTDGTQTGLGVEEGAEVNAIETISVNGVDNKLPIDSNRNVNIIIPTKLTDLIDDIAHVAEIKVPEKTDAYESKLSITPTNKGRTVTIDDSALQDAISAVSNSAIKAIVVNNTIPLSKDTQGQVNITATTGSANGTIAIAGQDVAVKGLGSAAFKDETHFKTKQDEVTEAAEHQTNTGTVLTYVESISQNANGVISYNTKEYNAQTAIINPLTTKIESIYKNVDGTESGALIDKINALKNNEIKANADAIAALAGTGNTSTVKKNADDIVTINGQITTINGQIEDITGDIATINGGVGVKGSMKQIAHDAAREAALAVETAAMEFMGAITELPTGLTGKDKGHFYKVTSGFKLPEGTTVAMPGYTLDQASGNTIINIPLDSVSISSTGYCYLDHEGKSNVTITLHTSYEDIDGEGNPTTANDAVIIAEDGSYSLHYGGPDYMEISIGSSGWEDGGYTYDISLGSTIVFSEILPEGMAGKEVKAGDSLVWNGYGWYVIPSGDDIEDTWRQIKVINGESTTTLGSVPLALIAGNNVTLTATESGNVTIDVNVDIPEVVKATMTKTVTDDGIVYSNPIAGIILPEVDKFHVHEGKVEGISTDLLFNGNDELILYGGNAGTGVTA